jgi:hypothetical protein
MLHMHCIKATCFGHRAGGRWLQVALRGGAQVAGAMVACPLLLLVLQVVVRCI